MPKRKRNHEPSLEEKLTQWHKELARGMKTAKGFERQRLSKRIREAQTQSNPDKMARLEREVAVLKSLDLQQAAHAHLCSSLLKIKGVVESPRLPSDIVRPIPKPEGLSEEEKMALHNVTSALCNRKQIRDVVEEAIMGTCIALRVPMPEKMKKGGKGQKEKKDRRAVKEEQADDRDNTVPSADEDEEEEEEQSDLEQEPEPVLLKRKRDKAAEEDQELDSDEDDDEQDGPSDEQVFEGFSDSDAEERAWSRYDAFVAGSSSDEDDSDEDGVNEEDGLAADSRAKSLRKAPAADDISISSVGSAESEEDDEDLGISESEDSDSESASLPPPKKAKTTKATKTTKTGPVSVGNSAFLPTLMGGYISGSESEASDIDFEPARKNRRGQRARQAIWEKKYKDKARHIQKQQEKAKGRDQGWDMRRGAVGDEEGSNKPWKKGIHNPFDKKHIHPERQQQLQGGDQARQTRSYESQENQEKPKPKEPPKRDDTGPLHPSWAAAKKAKEEGQKVAFQGRKVVFD